MGRIRFRVIAQLALLTWYIGAGWTLLTHLLINYEPTTIQATDVSDVIGVPVTLNIIQGGAMHCTTAAWVSVDTVVVTANEIAAVYRQLGCREPKGIDLPSLI